MILKLSHIGHAVEDMEKALKTYTELFSLPLGFTITLPEWGNKGAMLPIGDNFIELLEPINPQGFVGKFLERRGQGLYYISLVVDDLEKENEALKARGVSPIELEPTSALPFKTIWVHPRFTGGVLFELIGEEMSAWLSRKVKSGTQNYRLSHVGHAVRNITEVSKVYFSTFELCPTYSAMLSGLGIRNAMLPIGKNFIELIEPIDPHGFVGKFLERRGQGLYHISLVVDDIEKEVDLLKTKGVRVIEIEPSSDFPYKNVWIHPQSTNGVLFEMVTEEILSYISELGHNSPQA